MSNNDNKNKKVFLDVGLVELLGSCGQITSLEEFDVLMRQAGYVLQEPAPVDADEGSLPLKEGTSI